MTDAKFFRVMAALQLLIAFINFYVAIDVAPQLTLLSTGIAMLCTAAGVFCTVTAAKLLGFLD